LTRPSSQATVILRPGSNAQTYNADSQVHRPVRQLQRCGPQVAHRGAVVGMGVI